MGGERELCELSTRYSESCTLRNVALILTKRKRGKNCFVFNLRQPEPDNGA